MNRLLLILLFAAGSLGAYSQTKVVTGKVTTLPDGSAAPGVNVIIKGSTVGTTTDGDGKYSISIEDDDAVLIYSFIGYKTVEEYVGSRTVIDVQMEDDIQQLGEVVVVGYGTQIKQDLTGNIASVKGDAVANIPVPSFEQAVQGRAAGVLIEAGNGKLGQGIKVRIRGASSVSADNQPLYVIDGIPITSQSQSTTGAETNPLTDINPADIESIQILKDASASAIYGSRAANGVLLITTKRGTSGKTSITLGYQTGVSNATNNREWLNTAQYVELFSEAAANSGLLTFAQNRFTRYAAGNRDAWENPASADYVDTKWEDQVLKQGGIQQVDISANGGNEKTRFYISGSWTDQKGILVGNRLNRMTGRVNLDHKASNKLSFGLNFSLSRTNNFRLSDDNAFSTPMQIIALAPMTPVIDPRTGLLSGVLDLNTGQPNSNFPTYFNPLIDVNYNDRLSSVFRNFGTVYGAYEIVPGLSFRSEFGYDLLVQHEERYYGKESLRNTGYPNGEAIETWTQIFNYTTNNFLTFNKQLNDNHLLEAIVGVSYQESQRDFASLDGVQFPSNQYKEIGAAATIIGASTSEPRFSFLSYFARANYKFRDKYLIGVSGRMDGSSRFGEGNRYGFFPAASVGWILTEESFLENASFLSFLKLRGSIGVTGNAEIGNFASRGLYSGAAGYAGIGGQSPLQLENPDLRWEQTTQTDIGIDFGFFNNRLSGELDYYVKNTEDLLLNVNLPGTSGFETQIRNVGEMQNKGIEVVLNGTILDGEFSWNSSFNYARNRNKVLNLNGQVIQGDFLSRAVEGEPIGIFFGPKYAGVDTQNGDALYYIQDTDGTLTTTNDPNLATLMKLGDPNPDFIAGWNNNFKYKGFELSVLFQGVFGYDIYNGGGKFMSANGDFFDNQTLDQLERWQNPGDITDVPQARLFGANGTTESSRYLLTGGYARLKTVTLAYNFSPSVIQRFNLSRARLYLTGQNLLTFTNYEGWDPEVNSDTYASNINQGIDFYSAPQARTITFGVQLGF